MSQHTRRAVLRAAGVGLLPAGLGIAGGHGPAHGHERWETVESPTARTLHDVSHAASGSYAVGAGGVVVGRTNDSWTLVTDTGPDGNGNNLHGAATTADGNRLWMAGASGAVGEYDPERGKLLSRSAPSGVTDTFTDIAVTGTSGDATVYLTDSSGRVHVSRDDGRDGTWTHSTPGSGAAITAIDFAGTHGVLVDQNKTIFETTDGSTWTEVPIPAIDVSLHDIKRTDDGTILLAGDSGTVITGTEGQWEREKAASQSLQDVEIGNCGCVHAVGASGTVLHRMGHGKVGFTRVARLFDLWQRRTPTGQNLHAIAIGPPHVAVGAAGTILERGRRSRRRESHAVGQ